MDRSLIRAFWACGDSQIIDFAIVRARLDRKEKAVLTAILDDRMTQEETAEKLQISTRTVQKLWASGADKLLKIDWLVAYAESIRRGDGFKSSY